MKIFQNKNLFKKLIIVLLFITIFSFCMPKVSRASVGGDLMDAVMDLFVGIGDGINTVLSKMILQTDGSFIVIDTGTDGVAKILGVLVALAVVVGGIVLIAVSGGGAVLAVANAVFTIVKAGVVAGVTTFAVTSVLAGAKFGDKVVLPSIRLTPYEIFTNQIPLFDVDFFSPMEDSITVKPAVTENVAQTDEKTKGFKYVQEQLTKDYGFDKSKATKNDINEKDGRYGCPDKYTSYSWDKDGKHYIYCLGDDKSWYCRRFDSGSNGKKNAEYLVATVNNGDYGMTLKWNSNTADFHWDDGNEDVTVPGNSTEMLKEQETITIESTAKKLRPIIANWYNILRDISIVGMLSILVYVGIRIIISSTANDKAKYKQLLVDWVVALCLLFFMQYIMAFSNVLVKKITAVLQTGVVSVTSGDKLSKEEKEAVQDRGEINSDSDVAITRGTQLFEIKDTKLVKKAKEILVDNNSSETKYDDLFVDGKLYWPTNNFTEQARMLGQLTDEDDDVTNYSYASIGYEIIYIVLVMYTLIFTWTYVKRVVYMAFLTMIAPLVALIYPIDKMNDGKAQAFNMWFKEYIFNLLIQPLHLILYMVLIGSAMTFASQNLIYAVVALGFMTPAEKLMRKFFGFEKAGTPGVFAGPAGAAIMMSGMNRLLGKPPHPPKGPGNGGGSESEGSDKDSKLKFKEDLSTSSLYDAGEGATDDESEDNNSIFNLLGGGLNKNKLDDKNQDDFGNSENPIRMKNTDNLTNMMNPANLNKKGLANNMDVNERENKKKQFSVVPKNNALNRTQTSSQTPRMSAGKSEDKKKLKKPGFVGGMKRMGNRIVLKSSKDNPLGKVARVASGLGISMAAATVAGIASITDPENATKYMTTAAIAGYKYGKEVPDAVVNKAKNANEYRNAFLEGSDPEGYAEKQIDKNVKKMKKDAEYKEEVRTRLDKMGMTDVSFEDYYEDYGQYAIRKGQESAAEGTAGYALMRKEGYGVDQALQLTKVAKGEDGDTSKYDNEKSTNFNNTIRDRIVKNNKNKNLTEEELDRNTIVLRDGIDKASGYLNTKI